MGSRSNPSNIDMENVRWGDPPKGYALSGKIMLSAIVILFGVVVFMVVLHLYARWYILRERQRQLLRRRSRLNRRTNLVFYVDNNTAATTTVTAANRGLDASVLSLLPVFVYSSKTHPEEVLECAVCLSEFEENEKGRLLPKCNHSFHIECIDMWFNSHSTCPLCRSPVEPVASPQNIPSDVVLSVGEPAETEPGSSSGLCSTCQHVEEHNNGSTSLAARRKGLDMTGVRIEVSRRNEPEDELRLCSPVGGFKSPGSRLLSLRRILSMNRKASGVGTSCGSVSTELDIERGMGESTQQESRAQTPR